MWDPLTDVVYSLAETLRRLRQSKYLVWSGIIVVGVDDVEVSTGSTAVNCEC